MAQEEILPERYVLLSADGSSLLKLGRYPAIFPSLLDAYKRAEIANSWRPKNKYFPIPLRFVALKDY